jgi:hypothetical protein
MARGGRDVRVEQQPRRVERRPDFVRVDEIEADLP